MFAKMHPCIDQPGSKPVDHVQRTVCSEAIGHQFHCSDTERRAGGSGPVESSAFPFDWGESRLTSSGADMRANDFVFFRRAQLPRF